MLQIKHNFIPTAGNRTLAIVHWHDGKKLNVATKVSYSIPVLEQFVQNEKRDILVNSIKSYVKHRQYALEHSHTKPTALKANAITRIKRGLEVYSQSKIEILAKIILCLEKDLLEIMPGINSKYHLHYAQIINQLITYCKNIINGNE